MKISKVKHIKSGVGFRKTEQEERGILYYDPKQFETSTVDVDDHI